MKRAQILSFLLSLTFAVCAQDEIQLAMRLTASRLTVCLAAHDTADIFRMYDSTLNDFSNTHKRNFVKESISIECDEFIKILKKGDMQSNCKFIFQKDSISQANLLITPLVDEADTDLNIKSCRLLIEFAPDKFFDRGSRTFLNFTLLEEPIKPREEKPIKLPPLFGRLWSLRRNA